MKQIIIFLFLLILFSLTHAQTPQAFKYQAVVRDNSGNLLIEQSVDFQIDILVGAVNGSTLYSEIHSASTNNYGIVDLEIGNGSTTDDFRGIDWSTGPYFIKIWVNGAEMGTSQLLSVPFALYAQTAETISGSEIKNLMDPVDDQDAATKAYVDRQITNPGIRIFGTVQDINCFGLNNGSIDLTVTGGTPPYVYEWSNDSTTEDISELDEGKYQIYVVDDNGMSSFRQFTIHQSAKIEISHLVTFETGNIDITVTGGLPPYSYVWSNGSTEEDLSGVSQGNYIVEVTDALGCTTSKEIEMMLESFVLAQFLESPDSPLGKDYVNTDLPSIRTAEHVKALTATGSIYIIDIRSAVDFSSGHIEGAVNVAAGELLSHMESSDLSGYEEISIVDYSGQASSWATSLLRLMGYDNVYAMRFGMCAWHENFAGSWQNNIGNMYVSQFVSDATAKGPKGEMPQISTGGSTVQEILEIRINTILTEGFGAVAITSSTVFGALDDYYIINYWPADQYNDPGHIPGAIQYTPRESIKLAEDLKTLPTDKTIVVYDYTGHTSASLVAYLRLLGYDAKTLLFGTNGMIYDNMTTAKWSDSFIMGYDYVTD